MVRTGTVAYELLRPLDLYALWFCRSLALRSAPTVLRAIPMFVLAGLFFGMSAPPSWASAVAAAISALAALLLSSALSTLFSISLLWTISGDGLFRLGAICVMIFSGLIVPLPLFPDWAQAALNFMPFRGVVDVPFRIYMGHIPPGQVLWPLAHQVAWTLALIALGRWLLARGTYRLVVQGG